MKYHWDLAKSLSNVQKHGYSFDDIERFNWEFSACFEAQVVNGEQRELWIGPLDERIVVVVCVEWQVDEISIISLRRAITLEILEWRKEFQND